MKQRDGFVSNSSSASFIVRWSKRDENGVVHTDLHSALYDDLNLCDGIGWIEENTKQDEDGYFTTEDFCVMFNGYEDFSPFLNALIVAITMSDGRFKINEAKVEHD